MDVGVLGVLQVASFVAALVANAINSERLGSASRKASAVAVANGGANPSVWAFSIWGLIYALFATAYIWYGNSGSDWSALPPLLIVGWVLNIAWVITSTTDRWKLGLGLITAYLVTVCLTLPHLTQGDGPEALLGLASSILAVWLCAATLLNLQIALPSTARFVGQTAPAFVAVAAAAIVVLSRPDGTWPRANTAACVCAAVWVLAALSGLGNEKLLGDELEDE